MDADEGRTEPRIPASGMDENDNVYPKAYRAKEMRWEAVRDFVLFPLLKLLALALALVILGGLASGGSVPYELG